jgi:hypothetical protein
MRSRFQTLAIAALLAAGSVTAVAVALPAHADTVICDQFGSTVAGGRYIVQNNRWGTSAAQCINATDSGFTITQQNGSNATNGGPTAYPSIYYGCHYGNCSPGTNLPMQVSSISSVTSNINFTYAGGTYDAAYDIWLDPTAKVTGVNKTEIMIWFNRVGPIQPVGARTSTVTINGRTWEVWTGNNGGNDVVSYVATSTISSWNFNVLAFISDTIARGYATRSWYLTSIQAGFEPWSGGVGLAVSGFSATVNGGGGGGGGTTPPVTTPPATTPPAGGGGGSGSCRVAYTPNTWSGGFTGNVTITNSGSSALNGWTLTWSYAGNQHITSAWNATVSQAGAAVTARNVSYNGSIAPGGTASFGFQGTYSGTNASPTSFQLNGVTCS